MLIGKAPNLYELNLSGNSIQNDGFTDILIAI